MTFDNQTILFGKFNNRNMYRLQIILILTVHQFIFASMVDIKIHVSQDFLLPCYKEHIDRILIEKLILLKY